MSYQNEPLAQFKEAIGHWIKAYSCAGFSYHAIRTENELRLMHGRLFLHPWPSEIPKELVTFKDQQVGYMTLKDMQIDPWTLIDRFVSGTAVKTPHGDIQFQLPTSGKPDIYFHPLHQDGRSRGNRLNLLEISGGSYGFSRHSLGLDWSLKANNPPYDNLLELLIEFHLGGYHGDFSFVDVPAVQVAEIDYESQCSGEVASPSVMLPLGLNTEECRIGYQIYSHGKVLNRGVLSGALITWNERETERLPRHSYGTGTLQVPKGAAIKCYAIYAGIAQHEGWILDPSSFENWRRTTYEEIDPGCKVLKGMLFDAGQPKRDSRQFETGVACLLWMAGFSTLQSGTVGLLSDGPDLIATTPSGQLVLVECTTGILKEDKIAKLVQRSASAKEHLKQSGAHHISVLPMLVTSLSTTGLVHVDKANSLGVSVVTREDLQLLLDQSPFPQDANEIFNRHAEPVVEASLRASQ